MQPSLEKKRVFCGGGDWKRRGGSEDGVGGGDWERSEGRVVVTIVEAGNLFRCWQIATFSKEWRRLLGSQLSLSLAVAAIVYLLW